jgi:hypothetical protein
MSLVQSFALTPDLMQMVNQFDRSQDLIDSGSMASLKPERASLVEIDSLSYQSGAFADLFDEEKNALEEDFKDIVWNNFCLELLEFKIRKQGNQKGEIIYHLDLQTDPSNLITMNISKLGADPGNDYMALLREKPALCWLADSRSPFYIDGFSEALADLSAVGNFRVALKQNPAFLCEIIGVLGFQFVGEKH